MKLAKIILTGFVGCLFLFGNANGQINGFYAASNFQSKKDKPLKINEKPRPQYPSNSCDSKSGRGSFRVTFDKTGTISDVITIKSSGCSVFDESALKAAFQIKFSPAEKDGQPITVIKVVEYAFFTK